MSSSYHTLSKALEISEKITRDSRVGYASKAVSINVMDNGQQLIYTRTIGSKTRLMS